MNDLATQPEDLTFDSLPQDKAFKSVIVDQRVREDRSPGFLSPASGPGGDGKSVHCSDFTWYQLMVVMNLSESCHSICVSVG